MDEGDRSLEELLTLLVRMVDLAVDHAAIRAAARGHGLAGAVRPAAAQLGLSAIPITLTTRDAADASGAASPIVGRYEPTPGRAEWIVLGGYRGWRVKTILVSSTHLQTGTRSVAEIARLRGTRADQAVQWLSVQPLAPLAPATSPDHHHLPPFRRLLKMLHPERRDLAFVVVFSAGVGLLGLATPVAVQGLVNTFALGGLVQPLVVLALLLFIFLSLAGAFRVMQTYILEIVQRRIFVRVLADLAHRLPRLRTEVFERSHGPELVNRFFDVLTVQKASATLFLESVANALQTLIGLLVLAFYHPTLLVFGLLLLGAMVVVVALLGRGGPETAIRESMAKYAAAAWLQEVARHPNAFKLAGGYSLAADRADIRAADYLTARRQHFRIVLRHVMGGVGLQAVAGTALLAVGGGLVIAGELTLGQLVAAELIVSIVLASFAKIGKDLESFYDLLAAVDKLGHLIDLPLERYGGGDLPYAPQAPGLAVTISGARFRYENGPTILQDFDLALAPGERVLLAGGTGSGKSTLGEILNALRPPSAGVVLLDGVDTRDLRLESLRRSVMLAKEGEVITDTIVENVRFGHNDRTDDDVRRALAAVGLLDEVLELPDGIATPLNADGSPLSYGQIDRLVLARALVAAPRLLVVDGLLDDLSTADRQAMCALLLDRRRPWTVLVLTSHPEGIAGFDRTLTLTPPV